MLGRYTTGPVAASAEDSRGQPPCRRPVKPDPESAIDDDRREIDRHAAVAREDPAVGWIAHRERAAPWDLASARVEAGHAGGQDAAVRQRRDGHVVGDRRPASHEAERRPIDDEDTGAGHGGLKRAAHVVDRDGVQLLSIPRAGKLTVRYVDGRTGAVPGSGRGAAAGRAAVGAGRVLVERRLLDRE